MGLLVSGEYQQNNGGLSGRKCTILVKPQEGGCLILQFIHPQLSKRIFSYGMIIEMIA